MIKNPIFIIGCPRSGTTLLFNVLSVVPGLWSIGYESKQIIEKYHHPRVKGWASGVLDSEDVTKATKNYIISEFTRQSASWRFWKNINWIRSFLRKTQILQFIKTEGKSSKPSTAITSTIPQRGLNLIRSFIKIRNTIFPFILPDNIILLEKTPENCLRLPFLLDIFPDGRIIYIMRDGRSNIYSLMEGWQQPYLFPGYQIPERVRIPGDVRGRWAFTLIPGWQDLLDRPLEEVCAWQWLKCNQFVIEYLDEYGGSVPHIQIKYEDLITDTLQTMNNISKFIDVPLEKVYFRDELPAVNVVSKPNFDKWRYKQGEIMKVYPIIEPMMDRLGYI